MQPARDVEARCEASTGAPGLPMRNRRGTYLWAASKGFPVWVFGTSLAWMVWNHADGDVSKTIADPACHVGLAVQSRT